MALLEAWYLGEAVGVLCQGLDAGCVVSDHRTLGGHARVLGHVLGQARGHACSDLGEDSGHLCHLGRERADLLLLTLETRHVHAVSLRVVDLRAPTSGRAVSLGVIDLRASTFRRRVPRAGRWTMRWTDVRVWQRVTRLAWEARLGNCVGNVGRHGRREVGWLKEQRRGLSRMWER